MSDSTDLQGELNRVRAALYAATLHLDEMSAALRPFAESEIGKLWTAEDEPPKEWRMTVQPQWVEAASAALARLENDRAAIDV